MREARTQSELDSTVKKDESFFKELRPIIMSYICLLKGNFIGL